MPMNQTLRSAIATFGASAKVKLANPAAAGEPEDQLRAPLERLLVDLAELCGLARSAVAAVGESALADIKTRPDYAITVRNTLVGFIEVKAPGKGADPRRFRDPHDKGQWTKLQSLPNLLYTDGNEFSLWRSGDAGRPRGASHRQRRNVRRRPGRAAQPSGPIRGLHPLGTYPPARRQAVG